LAGGYDYRTQVSKGYMGDVAEVQEILAHRDISGKREYYVSWKGYDRSHDCWVWGDNMDCPVIERKYWEKAEKKCEKKIIKDGMINDERIVSIVKGIRESNGIKYLVEYENGENSYVRSDTLREYYPNVLISFLSERVRCINT